MKPIISFLSSFGFFLVLSTTTAQTTHDLTWGYSSTDQQINIEVGDTVNWTWTGGNHNLISISGPETFDSGFSSSIGFTFTYTFTSVGQTSYICTPHSGSMYGTINVTPSAPTGQPIQLICPEDSPHQLHLQSVRNYDRENGGCYTFQK